MRLAIAATAATAALLPALSGLAEARPITAGLTAGVAQSKQDADGGADANHTIGLFGRLGFTPRLAGQLEVSRIQTDDSYVNIRSATALLVVDLGSKGRLVPVLVAGLGLDDASDPYGNSTGAHHIEGGLGLEYRAEGGFTIGADMRLGGRTLHYDDNVYPLTGGIKQTGIDASGSGTPPQGGAIYYAPSSLRDGEYRTARITLGIQF